MNLKKYIGVIFGLLFLFGSSLINSSVVLAQTSVQEELSKRNLTLQQARELARQAGINPDNPDELSRFAKANGVSQEQIDIWLKEVGMATRDVQPSGQVQDLRDLGVSATEVVETEPSVAAFQPLPEVAAPPKKDGLPYFGYDIFKNVPDAFRPSAIGAVDDGYIVGAEDEMRLVMWGATELQYELAVDAEGRIFIPTIGQITVAGQTIKELRDYLEKRLSKSYSGLTRDPQTIFMDVTLTRLRPIRVFVIGELENPGGYSFSSFSSLFNVLYGVGGPTVNGSLRDIRLIRDGKVVTSFDLYEFLLKGMDSGSLRLQNNDRIFIPIRKNAISIEGPVSRPGIYELKEGEDFSDLISYAGNLKPQAYGKRFSVQRVVPIAQRVDPSIGRVVLDFNLEDNLMANGNYIPTDGDEITIFDISSRVENVVSIKGAVYQPGSYELSDNLVTVKDLILAADSLLGQTYLDKAELVRTNEDLTKTFISLDLEDVLNNVPQSNIVLQRLDEVRIISRTELESEYTVGIEGAIQNPNSYPWTENFKVYDLLFKGKGLFDNEQKEKIFLQRADLIRLNEDGRSTTIIPFDLEQALDKKGIANELLQPFDKIRIYSNTVKEITDQNVRIFGSVENPGAFEYSTNMTLGDLIIASGGFKEEAFLGDVEVTRLSKPEDENSKSIRFFVPIISNKNIKDNFYDPSLLDSLIDEANKFQLKNRDQIFVRKNPKFEIQSLVTISGEVNFPGNYTLLNENEKLSTIISRAGGLTSEGYAQGGKLIRNGTQVVIDVSKAITGRMQEDIEVLPGDEIIIPRVPNTVRVSGNVGLEGLVKYRPGEKVSYYLDRVGGMQRNSEKNVLLTQPDGSTWEVKRKGLFKDNPKVLDGATIRVLMKPEEVDRDKLTPREFLQETTALLTGALTVILLVDRVFLN
jgi:protein involved in polysaccharide export with SLBB domain